MPVDIPGSSASFPANVRAPAGGDDRTAASVVNGLTDLANRTAYLKGVIDDGVQKLRTADNIAALKALTGMSTNDIAFVPGKRVYRFNGASSVTGDDDWIVTPDSVGGRWEALEHGLREVASPTYLATLQGVADGDLVLVPAVGLYRFRATSGAGADGFWNVNWTLGTGLFQRVDFGLITLEGGVTNDQIRLDPAVAPVPNRIVEVARAEHGPFNGFSDVAQVSPGTSFGPTVTVDVKAGDVVELVGSVEYVEDIATFTLLFKAGSSAAGSGRVRLSGNVGGSVSSTYVAPSDGAVTFSMAMFGGSLGDDPTVGQVSFSATVIRK